MSPIWRVLVTTGFGAGSTYFAIELSSIHPKSPVVLYGCAAPTAFLVIIVTLLDIEPLGDAAFEFTYKGPLIITLSPILNLLLGPGVGAGVGWLPPSTTFWTSSGK